jgi:hypothetical protein
MGGIESTQGEKKALLPKNEPSPSKPTVAGVALGNLAPSVTNISQHSTTTPAPALEMPRLVIDKDLSIKLDLPPAIAAQESLAKEITDAIYFLFFYGSEPLPMRDPKKRGLDNIYLGDRSDRQQRSRATLDLLNGLVELIHACGIRSQDFLSAALRVKLDGELRTVDEFLTVYLGLRPNLDEYQSQKILSKCNELTSHFGFVFERLQRIFKSGLVKNLSFGEMSKTGSLMAAPYTLDPIEHIDLGKTSRRQLALEMLVLRVVLNHQQSWLSKSPDLDHLEKAAKATVLLHNIDRRVKLGLGVPTPPAPSELIINLAARAESAVAEEDLPVAVHCAEILETLAEVSDGARTRLAEVKGVIAQYDAEAEKLAETAKFDG